MSAEQTITDPAVVTRPEQPYLGITGVLTMDTIPQIADRMPEVFGWLAAHGVQPAGPPFFKYTVIDMAAGLEIEVGVPVSSAPPATEPVHSGVLPAGRYVRATHVGHPAELAAATAELLDWASARDLTWDVVDTPAGQRWGCRLEIYRSERQVPMEQWETELVFRLAD